MATRKKTIRVPVNFGNVADLTDATLTTLGTPTIYIPENNGSTPVTFTSVMLFVAFQDISTVTGATVGEFRANNTLNGASTTTVTVTTDLSNTGENIAGIIGPIDFTSHFTANFGTVTSKTCQVQAYFDMTTGTGTNTRAVYAWFELTYTYDDTQATHIKTVCIPFESNNAYLSTTAGADYCTLPQLTGGGRLCENSPVVRYVWLEVEGIDGNVGTTGFNLSWSFNAGGATALPTIETTFQTANHHMYLIDCSGLTLTGTNVFELWSSLASRFKGPVVRLWVTYEFTVSGTTRVLNSVELAGPANVYPDSAEAGFVPLAEYLLTEPGTINMRECSAEISMVWNTEQSSTIALGAQSDRTYTGSNATMGGCSSLFIAQRLDSGSAAGAALTLARGENSIDLKHTAHTPYGFSALVRLLYESDVHPDGPGSHSHTIAEDASTNSGIFNSTTLWTQSAGIAIPETDYYLHEAFQQEYRYAVAANSYRVYGLAWGPSEYGTSGAFDAAPECMSATNGDAELGFFYMIIRYTRHMRRYPTQPNSAKLKDVELSRDFQSLGSAVRLMAEKKITYHTMTFEATGTVEDSGGPVVGALVEAHREDTGEKIGEDTTDGSGNFVIPVFADCFDVFTQSRVSSVLTGRSENAPAA